VNLYKQKISLHKLPN